MERGPWARGEACLHAVEGELNLDAGAAAFKCGLEERGLFDSASLRR